MLDSLFPSPASFLFIHPSAWKWNSANFAFWAFSEVRMVRILGGCGLKSQDKRRRSL